MQLDSGLFIYEHDFLSGADSSQNNIVRQAGAAFALAEYYRYSINPAARKAIALAKKGFDRNSIKWKEGKLLALNGQIAQAKTGATALAVLAALLTAEDEQELKADRQLEEWMKGLLSLQQQDGGFAKKPGTDLQSAYSNGEVWLALAVYAAQAGNNVDKEILSALERSDNRFLQYYSEHPDIGFFHWGVMASATRYWSTRDNRFAEFIADQTKVFLEMLRPRFSTRSNSCYSIEGLLAGLAVLEENKKYKDLSILVDMRVAKEMKKNLGLQILPDQKNIRFSKKRYLKAPELGRYAGSFFNGKYRPQIRIDATQHCLSALLKRHARSEAGIIQNK